MYVVSLTIVTIVGKNFSYIFTVGLTVSHNISDHYGTVLKVIIPYHRGLLTYSE